MSEEFNLLLSMKENESMKKFERTKSPQILFNNCINGNSKHLNEIFENLECMDLTSRLGQFAWRQIKPSNILLPVLFRHKNREEYLCVQMIKTHLLSRISSQTISYWFEIYPISQYPMTIYEANLFDKINKFHSNGSLSANNQLDYSTLESAFLTPFNSFFKFYQFIYPNSQLIHSNPISSSSNSSSQHHKLNTGTPANYIINTNGCPNNVVWKDKEKQVDNNMYESSKNILSKKSESNNSFCRQILFHGKEILCYCTTSSIHLNEKDNQTISCLSIKDIVSIYFPYSSIEQFIQICRKKQITRFKPEKSTHCDSTLRLVNIQQLENNWNFIINELLPNTQTSSNQSNDKCCQEETSIESRENNLNSSTNSNSKQIPNENYSTNNNSIELNEQIERSFQSNEKKEESICQKNLDNFKEEEEKILSKDQKKSKLKKKSRRRKLVGSNRNKRRRKEKINDPFWIKKYSIESFSILIQRLHLPEIK